MQGLILIPDISGFTSFVNQVDSELGMEITSQLLNVIIDSNPLPLQISEIEGDAILFYKLGKPIEVNELFNGLKVIQDNFNTKFRKLSLQYDLKALLSLKFIIHYGNVSVYNIKGFTKLYGSIVIEAHSLLKNGSAFSKYALVTEDYFNALNKHATSVLKNIWEPISINQQLFPNERSISYYFFLFSSKEMSCQKAKVKTVV